MLKGKRCSRDAQGPVAAINDQRRVACQGVLEIPSVMEELGAFIKNAQFSAISSRRSLRPRSSRSQFLRAGMPSIIV
jgi:hypothetical protein